jgi:phenylacetic acid degradation operon negative regulatory protein
MSKARNIADTDRSEQDATARPDRSTAGALRPLNARSIALSILLGTHPPELPARALVALAELFGIPGGTMRTALSRMVAAGDVATTDGRYRLAGRQVDRQGAQDEGRRAPTGAWDGRWHTIVTVDDQRDLAERRRFRSIMANRRYGELRPDIWCRPSNLGPAPSEPGWLVTTGVIDGIDPESLVSRLWDLDGIAAEAHRLLWEMRDRRAHHDWNDDTSIPVLFTTSAAVVRFLRHEPLLPDDLTPDGWPVGEVRDAYDRFEADHQRLLQRFLRGA